MTILRTYWDHNNVFRQTQIRPDEWVSLGFYPANIGYDWCKDIFRWWIKNQQISMGITIRNQLKLFWGEQKGAYQWDFSQQPMATIDVSFFLKTCSHAESVSSSHGSLFGGHAIPMIYLDELWYKCGQAAWPHFKGSHSSITWGYASTKIGIYHLVI